MKKIKRSVWGLAGVLFALGIVLSAAFFSRNEEKQITDFVIQHQEELESIVGSCLNGGSTVTTYKGVEVEGLYSGVHPIVQFYYSGSGLVPSTTYYGFYYSEDDVPVVYQNCKYDLVSHSDNEWKWTDGTDNGGVTKRITDHWFYYAVWF